MESVCGIVESAFPGKPLDCAIVMKGSRGEFRRLEDRHGYWPARVRNKRCTFSLNNHFSCIAAAGQIGLRYHGQMGAAGKVDDDGHYVLRVWLPPVQAEATYREIEAAVCKLLGAECRLPNQPHAHRASAHADRRPRRLHPVQRRRDAPVLRLGRRFASGSRESARLPRRWKRPTDPVKNLVLIECPCRKRQSWFGKPNSFR